MSARIGITGAALLLFSLGCPGGNPATSLAISPSTLTLTAGSATTSFTATLTGSSATISWSLSGPGTISPSSGTTTSYTPPASIASSTMATLTATAGGLTATATITINPPGLTISPPGPLMISAHSAAVTFTGTLTGPTNSISWALAPATGAGTISASSGTTTTYTPPVDVPSPTSCTLTATAGALTATVNITINPATPVTLRGTVVNLIGQPVPNVAVGILTDAGVTNTATTNASGQFTLNGVTTPYDLVSVVAPQGVVYQGLTRTDPTILFLGPFTVQTPNSGTLSGTLNQGSGDPFGTAGDTTVVVWDSPETTSLTYTSMSAYTELLAWSGPATTTGTLHALQWSSTSNLPTAYKGYATEGNVSVSDGGSTTAPAMTLGVVTAANLSGTITLPMGFTFDFKEIDLVFADQASISLGADGTSSESFNFVTPSISGGTMSLRVHAIGNLADLLLYAYGLSPSAAGVSLVPPEPALLGLPADGATGINLTTNFSWTAFAGGITALEISPATTGPSYVVFTAATSTTIPDLSGLGLTLLSGAAYDWQILGLTPWTSVDAFAGGYTFLPQGVSMTYQSQTLARGFTTE